MLAKPLGNVESNLYIIETNRLGLRHWKYSDIPKFAEINKDPRVMEYFPKLLTEGETLSFVNKVNRSFQDNDFGLWAVEVKDNNEFIGFLGLTIPNFEADFTQAIYCPKQENESRTAALYYRS